MFRILFLSLLFAFTPINPALAEQVRDEAVVKKVKEKIYDELYQAPHLLHTIGLLMACDENALIKTLLPRLESPEDLIEKVLAKNDISEGLTGEDLDDYEISIAAWRTGYITATQQMTIVKIKDAKDSNVDYCKKSVPYAYAEIMKKLSAR